MKGIKFWNQNLSWEFVWYSATRELNIINISDNYSCDFHETYTNSMTIIRHVLRPHKFSEAIGIKNQWGGKRIQINGKLKLVDRGRKVHDSSME